MSMLEIIICWWSDMIQMRAHHQCFIWLDWESGHDTATSTAAAATAASETESAIRPQKQQLQPVQQYKCISHTATTTADTYLRSCCCSWALMVLASVVLMTRSSQLAVSALQSWEFFTDQDGSSWHKSEHSTSSQLLREFYIITPLGSSCVCDVCQSESDIDEPYDTDDRIIHCSLPWYHDDTWRCQVQRPVIEFTKYIAVPAGLHLPFSIQKV